MELNLLPADIDKFIKDAILKSALGKNIEKTIDQAMSDALNRYDSPIKTLVSEVIRGLVKDHLAKEENKKLIMDVIIAKITPETINSMLAYGIEKLSSQVNGYG